MNPILIVLIILAGIFLLLEAVAIVKRPGSRYKNDPSQQNPMEGKIVKFVENITEPENADGMRGHLEAIAPTSHKPGVYESVVKRILDVILSFGGLVVLSPVFLIISLWILIDDPGPVLFIQKRVGKDKQYFKLHNVFKIDGDVGVCNKVLNNTCLAA